VAEPALQLETHQPNAAASGRRLRFLAVHGERTGLLEIHRIMKLIINAEVVGACSARAALDRIAGDESFDAVLVQWGMPKRGALDFASALAALERHRRPALFAFGSKWPTDDLARALQLGADAVLTEPLNPLAVERELTTFVRSGKSASVARLLRKTGDRLLRPTPELWDFGDDEAPWKARMQSLAHASRKAASPSDVARWAARVIRALDEANAGPIGPLAGAALARANQAGTDELQAIAVELCFSPARLKRLHRVAEDALAHCGIPRRTDRAAEQVLAEVEGDAARRPALVKWTTGYEPIRRAAVGVYDEPTLTSSAAEFLARSLARLLGVDADQITAFGAENLRRVAAHLVDQLDERRALDLARLTILACSLKGTIYVPEASTEVDTDRLRLVRAALNGDPGQAQRVMALAAGGELVLDVDLITSELVSVVERVMSEYPAGDDSTLTEAIVAELSNADPTPGPEPVDAVDPADVLLLLDGGDLPSALTAAHRLPDGHPRTVPLLNRLAAALLAADRSVEGVPLVARALRLQPKRLPLYLTQARLALASGDLVGARRALDHLESVAPGFGDSPALRATLARAEGARSP